MRYFNLESDVFIYIHFRSSRAKMTCYSVASLMGMDLGAIL